eukprot:7870316-Lingulodinium_polyedra.AAC.1
MSVAADGRRQVTGGKGLKQTQAYTKAFGEAVVDAYVFGVANGGWCDDGEFDIAEEAIGAHANEEAWVKADFPAVLDFTSGP